MSNGTFCAKQDERPKLLNPREDGWVEVQSTKLGMFVFGSALFKIEQNPRCAHMNVRSSLSNPQLK